MKSLRAMQAPSKAQRRQRRANQSSERLPPPLAATPAEAVPLGSEEDTAKATLARKPDRATIERLFTTWFDNTGKTGIGNPTTSVCSHNLNIARKVLKILSLTEYHKDCQGASVTVKFHQLEGPCGTLHKKGAPTRRPTRRPTPKPTRSPTKQPTASPTEAARGYGEGGGYGERARDEGMGESQSSAARTEKPKIQVAYAIFQMKVSVFFKKSFG